MQQNTILITPEELYSMIPDPNLVILDASLRSNKAGKSIVNSEYTIPNAIYFDIQQEFSQQDNQLPSMLISPDEFKSKARKLGISNESKIVVYDDIGIYSSPRVRWMFVAMGLDKVEILDGGLPLWLNLDFPIKGKGSNHNTKYGDVSLDFNSDKLKDFDDINEIIINQTAINLIIDARSKGRFEGLLPEPRKGLASGHIPKSINIPFDAVLEDGRYKSQDKLSRLFLDCNPNRLPMTFSCGSGITASILYVAAEIAGFKNLSLYDGSWTEWATRSNDICT